MGQVATVASELLGILSLDQAKEVIMALKDDIVGLEVKLASAESERLTGQSILEISVTCLHQELLAAKDLRSDNMLLRAEVDSLIKSRGELSARNKELERAFLQHSVETRFDAGDQKRAAVVLSSAVQNPITVEEAAKNPAFRKPSSLGTMVAQNGSSGKVVLPKKRQPVVAEQIKASQKAFPEPRKEKMEFPSKVSDEDSIRGLGITFDSPEKINDQYIRRFQGPSPILEQKAHWDKEIGKVNDILKVDADSDSKTSATPSNQLLPTTMTGGRRPFDPTRYSAPSAPKGSSIIQARQGAFHDSMALLARQENYLHPDPYQTLDLTNHIPRFRPHSEDPSEYRAIHITNLPTTITLSTLMRKIRGGLIHHVHLTDTGTLTNSATAMVVFYSHYAALSYESFAKDHPITFTPQKEQHVLVSLLPTPSHPIHNSLAESIQKHNHTRILRLDNFPLPNPTLHTVLTHLNLHWFDRLGLIESILIAPPSSVEISFASVDLATKSYFMWGCEPYPPSSRVLTGRFLPDPCAGPLEEILVPDTPELGGDDDAGEGEGEYETESELNDEAVEDPRFVEVLVAGKEVEKLIDFD